MNKTKIPWCDYTINPVKGLCPMACDYCYARRMYRRFKWNPEIRYNPDAFKGLPSKPARIFVGSTIELFGKWVEPDWWHMTMAKCLSRPRHTFIFLTKKPENLIKWSPFPKNCWVGITVCDDKMANGIVNLEDIEATVKFVSYEPMLEDAHLNYYTDFFDWCILGSRTQPTRHPPLSLVSDTIKAMDDMNIPVFIKEPLASHIGIQRQEFPKVESDI